MTDLTDEQRAEMARELDAALEHRRYAREIGWLTSLYILFLAVTVVGFASGKLHGSWLLTIGGGLLVWLAACVGVAWQHHRLFSKP